MLLGSALVGLLKPCGADTHRDQRGVAPCRCSVCPAGLRRWRRRAAASAIQRAHVKSIKAPAAAAGHVLLSAPPGDVHAMANYLHNVETVFDSVNRAVVCAAVQVRVPQLLMCLQRAHGALQQSARRRRPLPCRAHSVTIRRASGRSVGHAAARCRHAGVSGSTDALRSAPVAPPTAPPSRTTS